MSSSVAIVNNPKNLCGTALIQKWGPENSKPELWEGKEEFNYGGETSAPQPLAQENHGVRSREKLSH